MVSLLQKLQRFRQCESGAVISAELVIVGTVVAAGLATGWAAVQNSVVNELRDLSEAVGALDQSYSTAGYRLFGPCNSCLASSAGSRYMDTQIICDEDQPSPMSECCLSPVIIHDTTRPGQWRCDRCGHQHHPDERHGAQQPPPPPRPPEPRDGSRGDRGADRSGPPPVPPIPQEQEQPRARPQPEAGRGSPRPQPDPGPERRPSGPPRRGDGPQPDREPGPFTPRDNPPRRQKTSESGSGSELLPPSEEPDDITQSDLYMLARLPLQDGYGGPPPFQGPSNFPIPGQPPYEHSQRHEHVQPHEHGQPYEHGQLHEHGQPHEHGPLHEHGQPHEHGPLHEHGQPHEHGPLHEHGQPHLQAVPIHANPGPPAGYPDSYYVPPRYQYRGGREPISTPWGHGPVGPRFGYRGCDSCDSCDSCRTGSIRPGVEFYSGVRGVRVTEIPQCGPGATPYEHGGYHHGLVPQVIGNYPGFHHSQPFHPVPYRVNRHEPRFPDYVWQPIWQVVW